MCPDCGNGNYKYFPGDYLGPDKNFLLKKRLPPRKNERKSDYRGVFECPVCHKNFEARITAINNGGYKSCGCNASKVLHDKYFNKPIEDLSGFTFGELTVISPNPNRKKGERFKYLCKCSCGNYVCVEPSSLKDGTTKSCGHIKSLGEKKIIEILSENNISFTKEKTFETCKNIRLLKFDFYLNDYNILIEYNGIQHYKTGSGWNNKEKQINTMENDKIKKEWCKLNDIPLIIIPYTDYKKLDFNYLKDKINSCGGCV